MNAPSCCFDFYYKYSGPELEVKISTDYDGSGNPTDTGFSWDTVKIPFDGDYSDKWKPVSVDLCSYSGWVYVAFRYLSEGTGPGQGARIGVDNILVARKTATELAASFVADMARVTTQDQVTFTAYVSGGAQPYTYDWQFGNGDTSSDMTPVYTYPAAGTYTVTLNVTDADGTVLEVVETDMIEVFEAVDQAAVPAMGDLRVATFNAALSFGNDAANEGKMIQSLSDGNWEQAQKVAEIIQRVNPDLLLINEFDWDVNGEALALFKANYLEVSQNGAAPIVFGHGFAAPSNTGEPSGVDFNNNGDTTDPNDAFGFGVYPGQYAMAVLSKYPIDTANVRTFQKFLWKDMPTNAMPQGYYSQAAMDVFRLSSKSHWDIPVMVGDQTVHMLCSHPTPPVFDDGDAARRRRGLERTQKP